MFRGFATVNVYAADHAAASAWYTDLFGMPPYFTMPGYHEFRVGDDEDEFGIVDAAYAPPGATDGPAGAIIHWHVDDVEAAYARLLELGATEYVPVTDRGHGFRAGAVVDPFGNVLGVMENPHFRELHASGA